MKSPLVITSFAIAGLLILAGVSYFLVRGFSLPGPPPRDTPLIEQPAPPGESKPTPEQPALSLEQQVEDLKTAIAGVCDTGESKEVTLVVTETEANALAAQMLAQAKIPEDIPLEISSVHIDFEAGNSIITEIKSVASGFIKVTVRVKAQVGVEAGKPKVEVTDVSFGFVPLPQSIKDRIIGYITQEVDDLLSRMTETAIDCDGTVGLEFKDISVQQTKMTVTVIIRPRM